MLLSLTGSAVANVLPLGGAAGIAMNQRMTRSWGFPNSAFVTYSVVTNVWDVLAKAFVPVLVLPVLILGGPAAHHATRLIAAAAIVLPMIGLATTSLLLSPGLLPRLHERTSAWASGRAGARWPNRISALVAACEHARANSALVAQRRWKPLTSGMALYTMLLFSLLFACLNVTGAGVPLGLVIVAFCSERLLTLIGLTPGGLGFVEVGLGTVLMLAPAANGAGVATGVLLYRLLTFGVEIPVGGALLTGWTWNRLRLRRDGVDRAGAVAGGEGR
jgi:uncharacterized membrane protein YbhN (UPF0104 family)